MKLRPAFFTQPLVLVIVTSVLLFTAHLISLWFEQSVLLNQAGPAVLGVVCAWASYTVVRNEPLALWTPIPWFLLACAVYFGFGPLIYHFGSEESVAYVDYFYAATESDLSRTNMLNTAGIALVLCGVFIGMKFFQHDRPARSRQFTPAATQRLMLMFLVIGVTVEFLFLLPNRLGLLTWTLPGTIQFLATFSKIAIILLFVLVGRGHDRYRLLLYGLIGFELVIAIMSFSKLAVIDVFITVGLGWYLVHSNLRGLVIGGVLVVLFYVFVLSPFVAFGRIAYSAWGVGTVSEVAAVAEEYTSTSRDDLASLLPGVQGWWTRFSYTNAQAFAMNDYDHGIGGETVKLMYYAFVPRLIFPDKPLMTPGREFTAAVTGYESETHTAPGLFAEAYWNGGWPLVIATCLYVGMVFAGFTSFVKRTIEAGKFEYLPVVMIGIALGYSPDSWFAATYVGSLAQAIGLYVVLRILVMLLLRGPRAATEGSDR